VGSDRDDDLAQTATAPGPASPSETASLGATLGRYRLERELGAGGMGVVHAAFDPDLERRIALKVLRVSAPSLEAKDRLMREARAMARLSHPNVVTVHEVGTAHGRDFVAMELIHGETLADWLRAEKRPAAVVIDAFVAAGRGIAAAHAAGIVHRDFKPHNVLRSRDGRIVVTDFGLAREAEGALPVGLELTLPVGPATAGMASTPSSLSGITMTGSLLGTPAYMAPEQWNRGAVTPATDQFAYCVALWEALAGDRPYRGPTLDDLRAQVALGPAALDASRIPRRLRRILRRGLDPAPSGRWPSMDALLAQLVRAERRPGIAIAIVVGTLVGAGALLLALRGRDAPVAACEPPARAVAAVWSPAIADPLRASHAAQVAVLDAALRDWQAARAQACGAPLSVQQAQLQCLDGVLARFDAVRQAFVPAGPAGPGGTAEGIQGQLIDPAICRKPSAADVPRLALAPTPDVIAAYQQYSRRDDDPTPSDAELGAMLARPNLEPCARVIATLAFRAISKDVPRVRAAMTNAVSMVDQCGDDRLRADLLIDQIPYQYELPMVGARGEAAIRQAQAAAARVMQPDVDAALAEHRIYVAHQRQRWDEAFRLASAEIAGYGARGLKRQQIRAVLHRNNLRLSRADRGDLEAVAADVATWRPIAGATGKAALVTRLDIQAARARYWRGDVAGGHADLLRLWRAQPPSDVAGPSREIAGEVVDDHGRPVAGAEVAAGSVLGGDAIGVAVPLLYDFDSTLQIVTTDATGRFVIHGGAAAGTIIAQHGALRSLPAAISDHVRLALAPTRRITGKVELRDQLYTQVFVTTEPVGGTTNYHTIAPLAADGAFAVDGASTGSVCVGLSIGGGDELSRTVASTTWPASRAAITDLRLTVPSSNRSVDVIVRSQVATAIDGAQVILLAGKQKLTTVDQIIRSRTTGVQVAFAKPMVGENVPAPALGKVRAGDLVAHVEHAAPGELTVCAIAFTGDLSDPVVLKRLQAHIAELAMRCEPLAPDANLVVVAVPPQQRFD
jgi:predicted Ser/Thr protein kinase